MQHFQIAVIVGSLRHDSFNRKLATAMVRLAPSNFSFKQLKIDDLPLYNQDDDAKQAATVINLKNDIAGWQGLLFLTPEYNRSIPGVLKNAIDHASRPYGKSAWAGKPAGVLGVSVGAIGTSMAHQWHSSTCAISWPTWMCRHWASPKLSYRQLTLCSTQRATLARPARNSCKAGWITMQHGSSGTQNKQPAQQQKHSASSECIFLLLCGLANGCKICAAHAALGSNSAHATPTDTLVHPVFTAPPQTEVLRPPDSG